MFLMAVPVINNLSMDPTPAQHFLFPEEDVLDMATTTLPNITTRKSNTTLDVRDENLARIEIALQALIFVFALFGNGFVLVALRYRKRKTSRMHIYITHLSIADMLVALLNILPQMAWDITFRFQGSDAACRLIKYLQIMVIYLSTYILVVTAVDRYRAICHPLSSYSWTSKKSHIMVGVAWIIAALLSLPQLIIFKMQETEPGSEIIDCWADFRPEWTVRLYITSFAVTVFFLPSLILCVLYGRICYVVWRNVYSRTVDVPEPCCHGNNGMQQVSWPENGRVRYKFVGKGHISVITEKPRSRMGGGYIRGRRHCVTGISRAKIKTIKLTFVVIIAYMVCWAPFVTTQMWWAYDETAPFNSSTFVICLLLVSLNSCCNPWIYMAFSESLVQQVVPCCRRKSHRKPLDDHNRERMRFTPAAFPKSEPMDSDEEGKRYNDDIPLQERLRNDDLRRKSTLLSRTTSTKLSTMYRTDSKNSRYNNVIVRYSREHGVIAAANVANWPCAFVYTSRNPAHTCSSSPTAQARMDTKVCECKKCLNAMEDKSNKKGLLTSWRERNEEKESSKSSSSSSRKRNSSRDHRDYNGKKLKVNSDNSHPFLSYKSYASEPDIAMDNDAKYTSV